MGVVFFEICSDSCVAPAGELRAGSFLRRAGILFPGILLTVLARWLFLRLRLALDPPILIYPSLTAAFAFALWLIFFR